MLQVEIRIKKRVAEDWSSWFEGLALSYTPNDETILSGELVDQGALYGLLAKLRDLGLPLESVNLVDLNAGHARRTR